MQINPDNSSSSTIVSSTTQNQAQLPGLIIPDGNGGVLATWTISPSSGPPPPYPSGSGLQCRRGRDALWTAVQPASGDGWAIPRSSARRERSCVCKWLDHRHGQWRAYRSEPDCLVQYKLLSPELDLSGDDWNHAVARRSDCWERIGCQEHRSDGHRHRPHLQFRRNRVRHGSTTDETTGAEFSSARGFQWAITD